MKNYESHSVNLKQVLSSAAFVKGFSDYKNRAGWREPDNAIEQWRYERGRLFAAWLESCGVELCTFKFKSGRWQPTLQLQHTSEQGIAGLLSRNK